MRTLHFASLLIVVAGCGDNNAAPDAHVIADARRQLDAPDASPDAPSGPQSRVWVVGDFVTNNTTIGGGFIDGTTLPFGNTDPVTPIVLPSATTTLADSTGYSNFVIDATADGTMIAFVGDLTTAGQFDLYVVGADGSNPTLLVAGQPGIEISSIAFSPDGSKLAYTADSVAIDNGYDLWVVNTSGTPVPV